MTDAPERNLYLRQPHVGRLNIALTPLLAALNEHTAYLVGSVLERPNFNDVDVVVIMEDKKFDMLFGSNGNTEIVAFAQWFNMSSSLLLSEMTDLKIDFRVQRMTTVNASKKHAGKWREPIGSMYRGEDFDPAWKFVRGWDGGPDIDPDEDVVGD